MTPRASAARRPWSDTTVLLVGENPDDRQHFASLFEREGFRTVQADHATAAGDVMAAHRVDLIVLDGRASASEALTFCRRSAVEGGAPIILLSDRADVTDHIVALEVGADDLIGDPVNSRLLLARTRALLRLKRGEAPDPEPDSGGAWQIDVATREAVSPRKTRVRLTRDQLVLFEMFLANPGLAFTQQLALEKLGADESFKDTRWRTATSRLRARFERAGEVCPIKNIRGVGYVYSPNE